MNETYCKDDFSIFCTYGVVCSWLEVERWHSPRSESSGASGTKYWSPRTRAKKRSKEEPFFPVSSPLFLAHVLRAHVCVSTFCLLL